MLGSFGIRWVLLPAPVDPVVAQRLDAALGLVALNKGASYDLWQVTGAVARVRVVAADGTTTALTSGAVNLSGVTAPASGGTLVLAEPYGGWTATLNGHALAGRGAGERLGAGIRLPGGASFGHAERFARVVPCSLNCSRRRHLPAALPGKRADPVEEAEALTGPRGQERQARGEPRVARRAGRVNRGRGTGRSADGPVRLRPQAFRPAAA